jgi:hypothetical protein
MSKTYLSFRAAAHKMLVGIRAKLNLKPKYSVSDLSKMVGLPVEYPEYRPAEFVGYLYYSEDACFIAVNQDLPASQQAWFIAQQIAFHNQRRGFDSLCLNRPWKWEMLALAPDELRQKICKLDEESRADFIMLNHATGDEFRAYMKSHLGRLFWMLFTDNYVAFQLSKLRIKVWFADFFRKIAFA